MRGVLRRLALALLALALVACAASPRTPPSGHGRAGGTVAAWPLAQLAALADAPVLLQADTRPVGLLSPRFARAAWSASERLRAVVRDPAVEVLVTEGRRANAFTFQGETGPQIAINLAMLDLLGDDEDAWAALLGHELAHVTLAHRQARASRHATGQSVSGVVGMALAFLGVPLGDALASSATELIERGYSRDDERDADRTGVAYLAAAGYDPEGAVRLQEKLAGAGGGQPLPFLSTHPGSAERIAAMRELVRTLKADPAPPGK